MSGSITSSTTTSGGFSRANEIAVAPSPAVAISQPFITQRHGYQLGKDGLVVDDEHSDRLAVGPAHHDAFGLVRIRVHTDPFGISTSTIIRGGRERTLCRFCARAVKTTLTQEIPRPPTADAHVVAAQWSMTSDDPETCRTAATPPLGSTSDAGRRRRGRGDRRSGRRRHLCRDRGLSTHHGRRASQHGRPAARRHHRRRPHPGRRWRRRARPACCTASTSSPTATAASPPN